jgi:hypothetical protein
MMNRLKCVNYVVVFLVLILIALSGCAGQVNPDRVVLNSDGTMIDTGRNLMWQQGRSQEQFTDGAAAQAYADNLDLADFDDWRLPTSQELWDLYFANDYPMAGKLASEVELDGSYWTRDGDEIRAGYLEDGDDPGINRYFRDSDKGFVRAVRTLP